MCVRINSFHVAVVLRSEAGGCFACGSQPVLTLRQSPLCKTFQLSPTTSAKARLTQQHIPSQRVSPPGEGGGLHQAIRSSGGKG
jgi:hypothetical protein